MIDFHLKYLCGRNVAILIHFHRYYFGRCSSELAKQVPCVAGSLFVLIGCMISMSAISFFAQLLWSSLPAETFPVTYDLNGSKYTVNR